MANQTSIDLIAKQEWLEPVEHGLQKFVKRAFKAGASPGRAA